MNDSTKLCQRAHAIACGALILASACGPSLSASICRAGLGETGEEIRERYGEPAAEFDRDFEGTTEKAKEMVFDRSGMVVIVQLHQGKSVEERVLFSGKDGPVTITEQHLQAIEAFLATNTNGPAWKQVPYRTADVMRYSWARQDDKALAWVSSERPFLLRVLDATSIVNKRDAAATQESNASEVAAAAPQQASPDYTKSRRWFSRSGKMLGAGVFAGIEDGEVRIRLEDGTVGRIRADKLSDADQLFGKEANLALEEAEELVLEVPKTPPEKKRATIAYWNQVLSRAGPAVVKWSQSIESPDAALAICTAFRSGNPQGADEEVVELFLDQADLYQDLSEYLKANQGDNLVLRGFMAGIKGEGLAELNAVGEERGSMAKRLSDMQKRFERIRHTLTARYGVPF